jgi:uncharacterized SAM-binding protein YcdF (DUF218 family)
MDRSEPLSGHTIQAITRYLDVDTLPAHATLAIILGTRLPAPAHLAAQLFHQERIDWVLLTGGYNKLSGEVESEAHQRILLEQSIPAARILAENRSTSTQENVRFSLPLLQEGHLLERLERVLVISKWYHCRRGMMTLKRFLPPGIRYYTASFEPTVIPATNEPVPIRRDSWWQHEASQRVILQEWEKIPRYLQQETLEEITFRGDAWI